MKHGPALIMAAPNGARRGKTDHPSLPITAQETAAEAARCHEAGAAMLHLHVRDAEGRHYLDAGLYREAMALVRAQAGADLLIQATTESAGLYAPEQQIPLVKALKPEAVSIALREIAPEGMDAGPAAALLLWMKREKIWPQFILYDAADVRRLASFIDRGAIPFRRPFVLFVLGRYAADQQSAPADLLAFLHAMGGRGFIWQVCAFGRSENECLAAAMEAGGHARAGFENNIHLPDGAPAPSSAALVALAAEAAGMLSRPLMTGAQARELAASSFA